MLVRDVFEATVSKTIQAIAVKGLRKTAAAAGFFVFSNQGNVYSRNDFERFTYRRYLSLTGYASRLSFCIEAIITVVNGRRADPGVVQGELFGPTE